MLPRLWPESTIVCVGSGPSLSAPDLALVAASDARILAINTSYQACPRVDVLYAADYKWWRWHPDAVSLSCLKIALGQRAQHDPRVTVLDWTGLDGLEVRPHAIRTGGHGGYSAINVSVHLGARRIVLLAYDMGPSPDGRHHHHADHPDGSHPTYDKRRAVYQTLVEPLQALGVTVVNASRQTTIEAFPRFDLEEALCLACP